MNTPTLATIVTAAFLGGCGPQVETYTAIADTQVVAENPTTNYSNGPASVGASAKIVDSAAYEGVIGEPKRMYVQFPPINDNHMLYGKPAIVSDISI